MTTTPADTRTPTGGGASQPVRPSVSRYGRIGLAMVMAAALAAVLLCMTPAIRFPSWREVVIAMSAIAAGWCLWQLRPSAAMASSPASLASDALTAVGVVGASLWSLAAFLTDGATLDLGVAAVVSAVVLGCRLVAKESGTTTAAAPRWYVPTVAAAAVASTTAWLAVDGRPSEAFAAGVAVTVAACPAAVALALPSAYRFGTRRGDALGIVIRGTKILRTCRRADTLVVDGIRPLVDGKRVSSVDAFVADHERNLRWFAGALEHASDHEIGRAIAKLSARGRLTGVQKHPGLGISGSVDRHPVRVGRPTWIGIDVPPRIGTTVGVEVDSRPLGTITVVDVVRPSARAAADSLRRLGVDPVLVTAERTPEVDDIAEQVGIERVQPDRPGATTGQVVERLAGEGRAVVLLDGGRGSGSADAVDAAAIWMTTPQAAPAHAEVQASADVELSVGDLEQAATAITLARAIDRTATATRMFAVAGCAVAAAAAAAGILPPMGAALALGAISLGVFLGATRLLRFAR